MKRYYSIGKKYCDDFYNGDIEKAIEANDAFEWTSEKIHKTFNCGKGELSDLMTFWNNNKSGLYTKIVEY